MNVPLFLKTIEESGLSTWIRETESPPDLTDLIGKAIGGDLMKGGGQKNGEKDAGEKGEKK